MKFEIEWSKDPSNGDLVGSIKVTGKDGKPATLIARANEALIHSRLVKRYVPGLAQIAASAPKQVISGYLATVGKPYLAVAGCIARGQIMGDLKRAATSGLYSISGLNPTEFAISGAAAPYLATSGAPHHGGGHHHGGGGRRGGGGWGYGWAGPTVVEVPVYADPLIIPVPVPEDPTAGDGAASGYLAQGTVNVVPDGITVSGGAPELDPIYQAALAYALGIANGGRQQLVEVCNAIGRAKAGDAKAQKFINYLPAAFRAVKTDRGAVSGALADAIKRRARPASASSKVAAMASAAQSVMHAGRKAMQARAMSL